MSWGGLPFYIYCMEAEKYAALMSGAMSEELNAGYTLSVPNHWVKMFRRRWDEPERKLYSLGVDITDYS